MGTNSSGLKQQSPFNEICDRFSPISNDFIDIMHDVLLGALRYDVSYALYEISCSKKKIIDLDSLNEHIKNCKAIYICL